jgi:hypothetical protein
MRPARILALLALLPATLALAFSIDPVIGVYTFARATPEGFENGFLRLDPDHAFALVVHVDADHDGITDRYAVTRGEFFIKRADTGEPSVFLAPADAPGEFLADPRSDGVTTYSFCVFGRCFSRKSENAPYFDDAANKPTVVGKVKVVTVPPGAIVFVDGRREPGTTPLLLDGLAAGYPHTLRLERTGFRMLVRKVTPEPGREITVTLKLPTGKEAFRIRSIPAVNVLVDGDFVGRTPTESVDLAPGTHAITLRNDGAGILRTLTVEIVEGKPYERTFRFMGRLSVDVGRPVRVFAGDVDLGTAPLARVEVPAGVHLVRLVPLDGKPVTVNVRMAVGKDSRITGTPDDLAVDAPGDDQAP